MHNTFKTLALLLVTSGAIKSWSSGETVTNADLNANFTHIHGKMVGGHGARLINSDVSPTAAIASTKLANGGGIAKAWASLENTTCTAGTCAIDDSYGITSVVFTSTGVYTVTLSSAATSSYAVIIFPATYPRFCNVGFTSTTVFTVNCYQDLISTAANSRFGVVVYDSI